MIRFAQGSGRYEFDTELFHFEATDDHLGRLRCVISQMALEDLSGGAVDPSDPERIFKEFEPAIFSLAETVFVLRGVNEKGVLAIASTDVLLPRVA